MNPLRLDEDLRTVLDSLTAHVVVLDAQGTIVLVNQAWKDFALQNGAGRETADPAGASYLGYGTAAGAQVGDETARLAAEGVRAVLDGSRQSFSLKYPCDSPDERRWFMMNVARRPGPQGGVTIAHENITERMLAEESLRASEERYRDLVAAVPGAVYTFRVDAAGRRSMPFMSSGIRDLTGLSADAVMADVEAAFRQIPADALPAMEQSIGVSLMRLSPWVCEFPVRTTGGEQKWVRGQSQPRRAADGSTMWHGVFVDITDRKRTEHALQLSEANLRAIADNASVGILVNFRGRHVFANRYMAQTLGRSAEELLGTGIEDVMHPEARAEVTERFRRRMAGEDVPPQYESLALHKDGRGVPVEIRSALTRWNGEPAGMVFVNDITERRRVQAALQESEVRYRTLVEWSPEPIAVYRDGRLIYVNPAAIRVFAAGSAEDLIGQRVLDIVHPDFHRVVLARMRALDGGAAIAPPVEVKFLKMDGTTVDAEIQTVAILYGGEPAFHVIGRDITERKRADAALRASEARLRSIYDNIQDVYFESTLEGTITEMSPQVRTLSRGLGGPEDYIGKAAAAFYADPARRAAFVAALKQRGSVTDFEITTRSIDGSMIPCSVSAKLLFDEAGRPARVVGTMRDIGERKRAQEALQKQEYLLSQSQRIARIGSWSFDLATRSLAWTDETYRLYGVSPDSFAPSAEALIGLIHPEDRSAMQGWIGAAAAGENPGPVEIRVPLPDGSMRILNGQGEMVRDEAGHPVQIVGTVQDVTERRAVERKFQDLFDYAPDANLIVNQAGCILMANRQAEALFGFCRAELTGMSVDALVPQSERSGHARLRMGYFREPALRTMGAAMADLRARRKNGATFPADISLSPLHSNEDMLVVATVRDITERRQAEAQREALEMQLRQSHKMEAIGTLAGGIAHDFNNILSAIIGNVELAREDIGAHHPARQSVEEIGKASRRARELVSQILAFSRQQPQPHYAVELPAVVEEVVKLLRAALPAGIELGTALAADAPRVLADPTQIHQVLMNLCTNAWHAMDEGRGRIDIHLTTAELGEGAASIDAELRPGRYARLSVRDTGVGMNAVTRERIFEPFFTTKATGEGTGLGLSVVHGIMRSYRGAVTVDSRLGGGSVFHLYFPEADAEARTAASRKAPAAPQQGRGQHVLYLDDDDALVLLITRMLERSGYRVSGYTGSAQALEALRADPGSFDLVVTDYNMPGMSGLDVAREVMRIRPGLPVALTSGYITDELREMAPQADVRQIIYKPNSVEELFETVRRLLDEAG